MLTTSWSSWLLIVFLVLAAGCEPKPPVPQEEAEKVAVVIEKAGNVELLMPATLEAMSADAVLAELRAREAKVADHAFLTTLSNPMLRNVSSPQLQSLYESRVKSQYGDDDRKDLFELEPANPVHKEYLRLAESVVALIPQGAIAPNADGSKDDPLTGTSALVGPSFGRKFGLCETERFRKQPSISMCSGALVGPDLVLTAGHCFDEELNHVKLKDIRVVFGYRMASEEQVNSTIPNRDIYTIQSVVGIASSRNADWAIVRLDRKVAGRTPIPIARFEKAPNVKPNEQSGVPAREAVFAMGYPCGLPLKVADNAEVWANSDPHVFVANLDTYGGNSGSPVFAKRNGQYEIVGVLIRGLKDFDFVVIGGTSICRISLRYRDNQAGEVCTRSDEFLSSVVGAKSE